MLIGYLRDDPGRNPAPAAYRVAVCDAFAELSAGTEPSSAGSRPRPIPAAGGGDGRSASACPRRTAPWTGLPRLGAGAFLNELLGAQIITLSNGAAALDPDSAEEDLEVAAGRRAGP